MPRSKQPAGKDYPRTLTTTASPGLSRAWGCSQEGSAGSGEARASILCPLGAGRGLHLRWVWEGCCLGERRAGEGGEEGARVRPCVRPSPCAMTVERGAGEEGPPPGGRPGLLGIGCRNPSLESLPLLGLVSSSCSAGENRCTQRESSCEQGGRAPAGRLAKGSNSTSGGAGLGNGKGPEQDLLPGLQINPGATTLANIPASPVIRTSFLVRGNVLQRQFN